MKLFTSATALASLAVGGCAASSVHHAPPWYDSGDISDSGAYAVGRGACGAEVRTLDRLPCAVQRATEDALLQIRAQVSVVRERTCRLDSVQERADGKTRSQAQSSCSAVLAGRSEATLEVSNVVPRHQGCTADQCFAVVALDRAQLAQRIVRSTAAPRTSFEDLLARARQLDLLTSLTLLAQAELLVPLLEPAEDLLITLQPSRTQRSFAQDVVQVRRERLLGVAVCLVSDKGSEPAPERVFASAGVLLSESGIEEVRFGPCHQGMLLVEYRSATSEAPIPRASTAAADLWTVSYLGRVRVSTSEGLLSREREVAGRGVAQSADTARRDAEDRLARSVRAAVAELLLGQRA